MDFLSVICGLGPPSGAGPGKSSRWTSWGVSGSGDFSLAFLSRRSAYTALHASTPLLAGDPSADPLPLRRLPGLLELRLRLLEIMCKLEVQRKEDLGKGDSSPGHICGSVNEFLKFDLDGSSSSTKTWFFLNSELDRTLARRDFRIRSYRRGGCELECFLPLFDLLNRVFVNI
jgi:hypothetical protein